jgi:hypothetical protein
MNLSESEDQVLRELDVFCRHMDDMRTQGYRVRVWARPMDVGGRDGSNHSSILSRLAQKGLAERRQRSATGSRGSWVYRITDEGKAALDGQQETPAT